MKGDPVAKWSINELSAHLRKEPQAIRAGFKTMKEWAKHFKVSDRKMRIILNDASEQGILLLDKVYCKRYDGQNQPFTVYSFDIDVEGKEE